jgi:hypothetical protein
MQITQFRTSVYARHHTVAVRGKSPTMVGNVVEYARFVDVQQPMPQRREHDARSR